MNHVSRLRALAAFVVVASALALVLPSAAAGPVPTITVIADGLDNPRGIALNATGSILVAESGRGGRRCSGQLCFGRTASITRVSLDGGTAVPVKKLPSLAGSDGFAATGAHDVAFEDGTFYIAIGGGPEGQGAVGAFGRDARPLFDLASAKPYTRLADLLKFERNRDPDGAGVDSNPYAVARVEGGTLVVDAGGNSLILVTDDGAKELVATFPTQELMDPDGNPIPAQAVPDTVAVGPDGAWYVGQLTGFPFNVGSSRVWRIETTARGVACDAAAATGPCTLFAEDLTALIDIGFDAEGNLWALELAQNGILALEAPDPPIEDVTGRLLRLDGTTWTEVASEGLVAPGGFVFSPEGRIFVTNFSIFPGDGAVVEVVLPA
jgi:hypothetical protein